MLAFTMQFSKHERTPTHTPTNHQTPQKPGFDAVWRQDQPARGNPTHQPGSMGSTRPRRKQPPTWPFPQDPTVCPTHPSPPSMAFLNPATRTGQYSHTDEPENGSNSQCSTNERTHPQDIRLRQWVMDPTPRKGFGCVWPVCSLERR